VTYSIFSVETKHVPGVKCGLSPKVKDMASSCLRTECKESKSIWVYGTVI